MATEIEAARLLCLKSAWEKDNGLNYDYQVPWLRFFLGSCNENKAVQIHGGNGFVKEYHVERLMSDENHQIYEGTSEIQKIIISRSILK